VGTVLCGLQGLLYFSIIPRIFIRRSLSENCSFHQNELLVSLSEHRSFLRRTVTVKNANLGITHLQEFVTFFTVCASTFQLLIEVSWFNKNKRETGNLAGTAIPFWPLQAQRVPGGWDPQILRQSAHEGGKVDSPTHRLPLPAGNIHSAPFCWPQVYSVAGRIMSMKISNYTNENQNRTFLLEAQWPTGNLTHVLFAERKINLFELHFWSDITDR
jgi:hypothetical protein